MKRISLLPLTFLFLLMIVSSPLFAYYYYPNSPSYGSYYEPAPAPEPAYGMLGHFFIGGQIGVGGIQTPEDPTFDYYSYYSDSINSQTFATFNYRGDIGYLFAVAPNFQIGPEVTYWGYGENSYSYTTYNDHNPPVANGNLNVNYSGYTIEYLLALKYYFFPRFAVTGQAGAAYVSQTLQTETYKNNPNNDATTSTTASEFLPDFGIGLAYDLSPNFSLNMSYDYIFGNNLNSIDVANGDNNSVTSVGAFFVGLDFNFL